MAAEVTKIRIDFDADMYTFRPLADEDVSWTQRAAEPATIEIDQEIVDEYNRRLNSFLEINSKFEQLYRIQRGLTPYKNVEIPQHALLRLEK